MKREADLSTVSLFFRKGKGGGDRREL